MIEAVKQKNVGLRAVIVLFIFSILLFGAVLWFAETLNLESHLAQWKWLQISEIKIQTQWPVTQAAVRSWLPPLEGRNLFLLRARPILTRLSERPWVESVAIKKEYPNRIFIDIATKKPKGILLVKGSPHFIDEDGRVIDRATSLQMRALDLPLFSFSREARDKGNWDLSEMIPVLEKFQNLLGTTDRVSQVSLGSYPFFSCFLSKRPVEVMMTLENWKSQVELLPPLLNNPPSQIGQPQKINLVLPKKAVVS